MQCLMKKMYLLDKMHIVEKYNIHSWKHIFSFSNSTVLPLKNVYLSVKYSVYLQNVFAYTENALHVLERTPIIMENT